MKTYTDEIIELLEEYSKLPEKIGGIKSPELLRENDDYRNLLRIESELKKYTLNGGEILEIYKSLKNIYDREKNIFAVRCDSMEREYNSKINDLEEAVSNLKESKNKLINLISDPNNFFNGEIVKEIKKEY